jgi:hypothetical protein
MRKKNTTRDPRAAQAAEDLETIREVYERGGGVSRSDRWHLSASINHAATLAGVSGPLSYPEKYEQAEKALAATDKYGAIEGVHYYCDEIRRVWERPVNEPPPDRRETTPKKGADVHYIACHSLNNCGFVTGETVRATGTADLRAGDIACVHKVGEECWNIGRVEAIDAERVTLRFDEDCDPERATYRRSELDFEGRVDPEPVGRWDGPTPEQSERLDQLRKRLAGIDADDCTNSSALLKIEREIYDIEHPPVGLDDWSEWED